jgi:NADH-quinone oxidoreductase subunit N
MEFTAPVLNYAQLAPILIVLGGALIGVLIEAYAPRASRHSSQLFITIASLVAAFAALARVRNRASVDAAMGSVAFDGAGVLFARFDPHHCSALCISDCRVKKKFTALAAAVPGSSEERRITSK